MSAYPDRLRAPVNGSRKDEYDLANQLINLSRLSVLVVGDFATWAIQHALDVNGAHPIKLRTGPFRSRRRIGVIAPRGITYAQSELVTASGPYPVDSRLHGFLNGLPISGSSEYIDFLLNPIVDCPEELKVRAVREVGPDVSVVTPTAVVQGALLAVGRRGHREIDDYNDFARRARVYAGDEFSAKTASDLQNHFDPLSRIA